MKGGEVMEYLENYKNLAVAIVTSMIDEYKTALFINDKYTINKCEKWFRSDWCYMLCDMDGDYIIKSVREVVQNEKNNRRNERKGVEEIYKTFDEKGKYTNTKHW